MADDKLRRRLAWEAARLMYAREELEYFRAKRKAVRRLGVGPLRPSQLPSNRQIREQIQALASRPGDRRTENLRAMRREALRMMRLLRGFRPRLIGRVLSGHVRRGSEISLQLFTDSLEAVRAALDGEGMLYEIQRRRVGKQGLERTFLHLEAQFPFELILYPAEKAHAIFRSSITGKAIQRASIGELERLLTRESRQAGWEPPVREAESRLDRFHMYRMLLLPLEQVKENPRKHPEGDALYHSLQVFDLAREERPYDEEFLLAALLHDVGKAIDPREHVAAGLEALDGFLTPRTAWLIEHHPEAQALAQGTLGARSRRRLAAADDYEEVKLLAQCDRRGRQRGVATPDVDDALEYLRELARSCDE